MNDAALSVPTWRRLAEEVIDIECQALSALKDSINDDFFRAVELLRGLRGKIICCGTGKSGHVAGKLAATLSSTGTPAFFMHPSDAGHGDLGMVSEDDAMLMISYSGESEELQVLIPALKRLHVPIVAIVGNGQSAVAEAADICLLAAVQREACPHNLAPTASTTAAMVLGDALAMTLLQARGFSPDDFARTHPSGNLGKRLLWRVSDIMRQGEAMPVVSPSAPFADILREMTDKRMGMAMVCDGQQRLQGIITDGDLRRAIDVHQNVRTVGATDLMTTQPRTVVPTLLAVDALQEMKKESLNHLIAVEDGRAVGALSFHDLLRHRIF